MPWCDDGCGSCPGEDEDDNTLSEDEEICANSFKCPQQNSNCQVQSSTDINGVVTNNYNIGVLPVIINDGRFPNYTSLYLEVNASWPQGINPSPTFLATGFYLATADAYGAVNNQIANGTLVPNTLAYNTAFSNAFRISFNNYTTSQGFPNIQGGGGFSNILHGYIH